MSRFHAASERRSGIRGSVPQTVRQIWDDVQRDDCVDLAAQMSFYFVLSLFPFLVVIGSVVGWLPSTAQWPEMVKWLTHYLPPRPRQMVLAAILDLTRHHLEFFSYGLAATIWIASSGFVSLIESLSVAYGFRETRGFWKKRILAIGAMIVGTVLTIVSFVLLTFGRLLAGILDPRLQQFVPFPIPWQLARWVTTLVLMILGLDLIAYFLPNGKRPWHWLTAGNVFDALGLAAMTEGFNFYLRHFGAYPKFYGTMAAFIILMTWIYIASLILLVGAEIDSVKEKLQRRGTPA